MFKAKPTPAPCHARGFSLLEILVAISILALSLTVLYQAQIHGIKALGQSFAYQRAILYGQSLLADMSGPGANRDLLQGEFPGGYRWHMEISPLHLPPSEETANTIMLLVLDLHISWQEGAKSRELVMQSITRP